MNLAAISTYLYIFGAISLTCSRGVASRVVGVHPHVSSPINAVPDSFFASESSCGEAAEVEVALSVKRVCVGWIIGHISRHARGELVVHIATFEALTSGLL